MASSDRLCGNSMIGRKWARLRRWEKSDLGMVRIGGKFERGARGRNRSRGRRVEEKTKEVKIKRRRGE